MYIINVYDLPVEDQYNIFYGPRAEEVFIMDEKNTRKMMAMRASIENGMFHIVYMKNAKVPTAITMLNADGNFEIIGVDLVKSDVPIDNMYRVKSVGTYYMSADANVYAGINLQNISKTCARVSHVEDIMVLFKRIITVIVTMTDTLCSVNADVSTAYAKHCEDPDFDAIKEANQELFEAVETSDKKLDNIIVKRVEMAEKMKKAVDTFGEMSDNLLQMYRACFSITNMVTMKQRPTYEAISELASKAVNELEQKMVEFNTAYEESEFEILRKLELKQRLEAIEKERAELLKELGEAAPVEVIEKPVDVPVVTDDREAEYRHLAAHLYRVRLGKEAPNKEIFEKISLLSYELKLKISEFCAKYMNMAYSTWHKHNFDQMFKDFGLSIYKECRGGARKGSNVKRKKTIAHSSNEIEKDVEEFVKTYIDFKEEESEPIPCKKLYAEFINLGYSDISQNYFGIYLKKFGVKRKTMSDGRIGYTNIVFHV